MNLVIALLSTRQFLSAERIRASVAGYEDSATDEAFSRMFERDKNELRDLGIPLEVGPVGRFSTLEGYRINRDAYELPDIDLSSGMPRSRSSFLSRSNIRLNASSVAESS